jgi:RNA polymerase sigma factor (sigma-70 family)
VNFSDEELMARYVGGDSTALRSLFDRYLDVLTRMMARSMATQAETNDLVQQTFLQLHRARHDFKSDAKLRPWLMTIAMNIKRQHLRKLSRRREDVLTLNGYTDPQSAPHDPVAAEKRRTVRMALATLPASTREVIELHWFEGLSFQEVARICGASVSAVKVRAHRGYAKMRAFLEAMECNQLTNGGIQESDD